MVHKYFISLVLLENVYFIIIVGCEVLSDLHLLPFIRACICLQSFPSYLYIHLKTLSFRVVVGSQQN